MYRKQEPPPIPPENFELTFEGKLSSDNRWVIMAELIPWSEFEEEYASFFHKEMGAPAKSFRMALGALIIKEKEEKPGNPSNLAQNCRLVALMDMYF